MFFIFQTIDAATGLGMGNGSSQLGGNGHQQGDQIFLIAMLGMLLQYQHPQDLAVMDDRHAQKGVIPLLTGFGKVTVAGVIGGVVEVDEFGTLRHQTHQPFIEIQAHITHGFWQQTITGHQHQLAGMVIDQIDRADIHRQRGLDPLDDDRQGLIQIAGCVHLLGDTTQDIEHMMGSALSGR